MAHPQREIVYFEDVLAASALDPSGRVRWRQVTSVMTEQSIAVIKGPPGDVHYFFTIHVWTKTERSWGLSREHRRGVVLADKPTVAIRTNLLEKQCINGTLYQLLPKEVKAYATDMAIAIKLREGWTIHARDVIKARNQVIRQRALKAVGNDKFMEKVKAEKIHEDRAGTLLRVPGPDLLFVKVIDPSTAKIYLLQVPNNIRRAKQGVAWTFNMTEEQYSPDMET